MWRFVDTAGLRRRVDHASGIEYYASLRTAAAIEAAEVAVVLVDASEPLAEQDQRVIGMVEEAGRALVLAFNKWDLVDEDRRLALERELERDLVRVQWAERVNVSALTGRAVAKIAPALRTALASWDTRIPTGRLNGWLADVVAATPPPVRSGKQPKILFATQAEDPAADRSCCSPRASWRRATGGSWSGGCARSSGSRARRSGSRCGCGRSGAARADGAGRRARGGRRADFAGFVESSQRQCPCEEPAGSARWGEWKYLVVRDAASGGRPSPGVSAP